MPASTAWRTIGSAAAPSRNHSRCAGSRYVIIPRQIRDTLRPVEPRRTCSMRAPSEYGWVAAQPATAGPRVGARYRFRHGPELNLPPTFGSPTHANAAPPFTDGAAYGRVSSG